MSAIGPVGRRWLFTGDSITQWGRTDMTDPHDLGEGYVRILTREHLAGADVLNTGVGGDRLTDLRARWDADVVALRPDVLSVYIGINDTWRRYDRGLTSPVNAFGQHLRELLEPLAAANTPLVLVSPFVLPVPDEDRDWGEDLGPRIGAIADVAAGLGAIHVALQGPMDALAARIGPRAVAADGVHPTPAGHRVIADQWWRAWSSTGPDGPRADR